MKQFCTLSLICLFSFPSIAQNTAAQNEFDDFIQNLETEFIYYDQKKEIIDCVQKTYRPFVDTVSSIFYKVLFYELLLNELYDTHINLNSNTDQSYRLYSPLYVRERDGRFYVANVFSSHLEIDFPNVLKAELITFNGLDFQHAIQDFPTHCHDKNEPVIREWLANKVLAGKRNEPRKLGLRLKDGKEVTLDLDELQFKTYNEPLTYSIENNIGFIRINNSLGNSDLVAAFDAALDEMMDTEALILDLRNTPDGGNTGVAEPMIGRFIDTQVGYQLCENKNEKYTRFAYPIGKQYIKPLYVLVGRWTGSMGEGMAIGFDGIKRATIVGTEMHRLAGSMKTVNFSNSNFGYRISFEKLYHLDGTLRETFVPKEYVNQESIKDDEFLARALALIKQ